MSLLFVVGTGRCGSTLVQEIISKHRDVGFISNIDDRLAALHSLGRWNSMVFRSPLGNMTAKGRPRFAPSEAYRLISSEVSPIYANSSRDLSAADVTPWLRRQFEDFFDKRIETQGKPNFVHKYTGWSRLGFFSEIFPEARFVHVVRDGRAVANSWLQMPWWGGYRGPENWQWGALSDAYAKEWLDSGQSYVTLAAIGWKLLMDSFEASRVALSQGQYLEVKYESLLSEPEQTMKSICAFSGVEWNASFQRHVAAQHLDASRLDAYRRCLTDAQLQEIETSLQQYLAKYDYNL
jgi:hypothetical protein